MLKLPVIYAFLFNIQRMVHIDLVFHIMLNSNTIVKRINMVVFMKLICVIKN